MSWWGGGLMSPTPGVLFRVTAMSPSTFFPGSSPPSPGLAPWGGGGDKGTPSREEQQQQQALAFHFNSTSEALVLDR